MDCDWSYWLNKMEIPSKLYLYHLDFNEVLEKKKLLGKYTVCCFEQIWEEATHETADLRGAHDKFPDFFLYGHFYW